MSGELLVVNKFTWISLPGSCVRLQPKYHSKGIKATLLFEKGISSYLSFTPARLLMFYIRMCCTEINVWSIGLQFFMQAEYQCSDEYLIFLVQFKVLRNCSIAHVPHVQCVPGLLHLFTNMATASCLPAVPNNSLGSALLLWVSSLSMLSVLQNKVVFCKVTLNRRFLLFSLSRVVAH